MSKKNKTGHKATTAAKSAATTATASEVVGRIQERNAKRHEVGKYAGVRGAIEAYEDAPIGRATRTLAADYYRKHERPASCVEFADDGNAVTIRVTGKAYENLTKLAAAQNSVSWCGNDNTAATTLDFWVGSFLWRTQYAPGSVDGCDITDVMNDIQDGIDTGHPDGTPEDAARKRELSAAFDAVKF